MAIAIAKTIHTVLVFDGDGSVAHHRPMEPTRAAMTPLSVRALS